MKELIKLIHLFTTKERRSLFILTGGILIMALFEVVGIGAIGPFMTVAADPSIVEKTPILLWLYNLLGVAETQYFIAVLGLAFFLIILITNGYTTVVMYHIFRWSNMRSYSLGRRLMSHYLYQPYSYFLNHNTSELSKNILAEVQQVLAHAIRPGMELIARGIVAVAILIFLFISSPLVALVVTLVVGGAYALVYGLVRSRLTRIGFLTRRYNKERFKYSGEAFGAIKDVKILGKEPVFEQQFAKSSRRFAHQQANRQILTSLPRYIIEAIALGLVVLLIVVLVLFGGDFASTIPLISVYAFAGFRLLPALRIVFKHIGSLRSAGPIVAGLYSDLTDGVEKVAQSRQAARTLAPVQSRLPFGETIELRDISFSYPSSSSPVLDGIELKITKNSTVGFIGPTGCGKTTLIDVILGLLDADGSIVVDGTSISEANLRNWQLNFGYVPQQIFLADDTVTRNIAFGVDPETIDFDAVRKAARIAHLDEFVVSEMPQQYDTLVGERGVRLSGGQRQRVGIARALYHDPDILVLDEATSALDNLTEAAVMDAINELMGEKTIIMIAHRISTVQKADAIYLLEKGRISASGSYDELLEQSAAFRRMTKIKG